MVIVCQVGNDQSIEPEDWSMNRTYIDPMYLERREALVV